ncbi:nuclear transport factor 2 family protein [Tsukamurella sp. 8F]|uniref:ester cyclase n=1 Tax=unclassified Tsukamurella TaxID=2633480 RepID=UPI0023B9CF5F|nr:MULTISPECIES: ester cyclase [unclassified Tsukamurella]MDF0528469.1 nuclear transport factor 2 family protein [Tsukamurella sp. 8J]MDF0586295.1 nuclear transport factor 2 family protein [Tsukamurella sp. 8F]
MAPDNTADPDNAAVLKDVARAWNSQDIDLLTSLFTKDCRYQDLALGETHRGRSGVRTFAEGVYETMPDFSLDFSEIDASEHFGATAWTITATWLGDYEGVDRTGTVVKFAGISRYRFADGLVSLNVDCWDSVQMIRQMRVLPSALTTIGGDR